MSENNKRTDDELDMEELFCEAENIFQAKRTDETEKAESQDAVTENEKEKEDLSQDEESQSKFAKTPAPENSTEIKPKYAKTPAPSGDPAAKINANIQTPVPQTEALPNEEEKISATVIISRIVLAISLIAFLAAGAVFAKNYYDMRKNKLEAQKLALCVTQPQNDEADLTGADGILEKYRDLYNQNHDLVGWITVPNTKIDHPVVQAADNDYYLRKNFSKSYERRGSIFMDFRCNPKDYVKNTILYGHNYLDSTMFSDLEKYKDLEFYKSAPVIEFNSIYKNQKWKVFGVYLSNADEKDDNGYALYYIYPFMTDDNFEAYVQTVRERSIINTPVDVEKTDKILTLSTCTRDMDLKGHGQTNARCVIVARLVRDGEKEDVNVAAATYNENPRYPQIWYTAHGLENPYVNASRWYPEGNE